MKEHIFSLIGPPVIVGLVAGAAFSLPFQVLDYLTAWTVLSFPIGIMIGHLARGGD